ncbi:OsmC family protein [soil metagenome]
MNRNSIVQKRQQPLMDSYVKNPKLAWVTDEALIEGTNLDDPFHTSVLINDELKVPFKIGVHRAVGGLHDFPNPGDMLCASLAACFESSLRMIANRLDVGLKKTMIKATANADVRGTLMVDKNVPVAFQSMGLDVKIEVDCSVEERTITKLLEATERCCIIFQTLKTGIPIHLNKEVAYTGNED